MNKKPSEVIREKLEACGGEAKCPMLIKGPITIWLTDEGVNNSGYSDLCCAWEEFDLIVDEIRKLGGTMYRGDQAAQIGLKLGSVGFPLNTMDAFIAINFYNKKVGQKTTRRSTYYAAILAWAGICYNYKSMGKGGYVILTTEWR